jgi:hypothetical protein
MTGVAEQDPTRRTGGLVAGLMIATGIPASTIVIAALWHNRIIELDPAGALVHLVQTVQLPALILAPVGIVVVGWALRLRGLLPWLGLVLWGIPVLAVAWFVGAAWIGGLAGEPF